MINKKSVIHSFEYFINTNSITVHKEMVFFEDDIEIFRSPEVTDAFTPDQYSELITFIGDGFPPLINFINLVWTPELIQEYIQFKLRLQTSDKVPLPKTKAQGEL